MLPSLLTPSFVYEKKNRGHLDFIVSFLRRNCSFHLTFLTDELVSDQITRQTAVSAQKSTEVLNPFLKYFYPDLNESKKKRRKNPEIIMKSTKIFHPSVVGST